MSVGLKSFDRLKSFELSTRPHFSKFCKFLYVHSRLFGHMQAKNLNLKKKQNVGLFLAKNVEEIGGAGIIRTVSIFPTNTQKAR